MNKLPAKTKFLAEIPTKIIIFWPQINHKKFEISTWYECVEKNRNTGNAIKQSSKAIGPDGMSNLHLKHLGPLGLEYQTNIFNLSLQNSIIPQTWKKSINIPLFKPDRDLFWEDLFLQLPATQLGRVLHRVANVSYRRLAKHRI